MAYRIIFEDVKKTIHEIAFLDGVPNVGDVISITHYDASAHPTGEVTAFPIKHRTFEYSKFHRPAGGSLDSHMHLDTVHILLGDPVQPVVFEKTED